MKQIILIFSLFLFGTSAFASNKRFNIYLNPIGLALGVGNIGLDVAVTKNVTLGAGLSYASYDDFDTEVDASGFILKGQYFVSGALDDSWYFSGFYNSASGDAKDKFSSDEASIDVSGIGGSLGYMWMWSNFNIQLGLGLQSISVDQSQNSRNTRIDVSDVEGTLPVLDFNIGLAF